MIQQIKQRGFGKCHFLEPRFASTYFNVAEADEDVERAETRYLSDNSEIETWQMRPDGTAVVPISGVLFHGSSWWSQSFYQGYNTISANVMAALGSGAQRLALIFDSPGGEVDGCFACARKIRDMADTAGIPMWAFSNESMYSAAYAIGSQADRIILPNTAGVASVGVVSTTVSYEKYLEQEGIQVNLITSGDKKVVGSPYEDLSEEDRQEIQNRVDKYAGVFFETVAAQRPMSVEQIEAAQANIFIGSDATTDELKFADDVMDLDDFYYAFGQETTGKTLIYTGENSMNKEDLDKLQAKAAKADKLESENTTLSTKNTELEERVEALEGDLTEANTENERLVTAAKQTHERYVAVMESDEAVGRQDHAKTLLADELYDNFSAEQLCKHLSMMTASTPDADEDEDSLEMQKMLAAAREKESDTGDITNRGTEEGGKDKASVVRDDKGRIKSESYSSTAPKDRTEHMDALSQSAAIVKRNRARKHI